MPPVLPISWSSLVTTPKKTKATSTVFKRLVSALEESPRLGRPGRPGMVGMPGTVGGPETGTPGTALGAAVGTETALRRPETDEASATLVRVGRALSAGVVRGGIGRPVGVGIPGALGIPLTPGTGGRPERPGTPLALGTLGTLGTPGTPPMTTGTALAPGTLGTVGTLGRAGEMGTATGRERAWCATGLADARTARAATDRKVD